MQHIPVLPGKGESVTLTELQMRCHEKPFRSMAAILDSPPPHVSAMFGHKLLLSPQKSPCHHSSLAPSPTNTNPGGLLHLDPAATAQAGGWEGWARLCLRSHQVGMICSHLKSSRCSYKGEKKPGLITHLVLFFWLK